jgi:uncharacterized protein (PEP-CTERM system associated)
MGSLMLGPKVQILSTGILGLFLAASLTDVQASRWKTRANIGFTVDTYSGNVFFDDPNEDERDQEVVLRLRPRFHATRQGGRARASISYVPELRYYVNATQSNEIVHFLNASGDVEAIERRLGIRASARAGQQVIDPAQASTEDGVINPDNITNTYSFSISPYLYPIRFGRYATLNIATDIGFVANQDAQDSRASSASISLVSGPEFGRFFWSIASSARFTDYEDETDNTFANVNLGLGYHLDRQWTVRADIGKDNNDVQTTRDIDGLTWRLGVDYRPNPRASMSLGYGERYNSQNFDMDFNYRHKRSSWRASYARTLQTANDAFLQRDLFPTEDFSGTLIEDPTLDSGSLDIITDGPALDSTVSIVDSFNLGYSSSYRRTDFGIDTRYNRRDNLQRAEVTKTLTVGLNATRRLTPKASLDARVAYLTYSNENQDNNDYDQWTGSLGYSYSLSENWNLNLAYRVTVRDGSDPARDFTEDRISLNLISSYDTQN